MSQLHSKLSTEALAFKEEWPYIPHLTIVKMSAEGPAQTAFQMARERWSQYSGSRRILLERLTFVREDIRDGTLNCWVDLALRGPRPDPGFAITGRNRRLCYCVQLLPPSAHGPRYISLPCVEKPAPMAVDKE